MIVRRSLQLQARRGSRIIVPAASLHAASPSRSLGHPPRSNRNGQPAAPVESSSKQSSNSSTSPPSSSSNYPFHKRNWEHPLLARSSFFCSHRPLVAPQEHHGALVTPLSVNYVLYQAETTLLNKKANPSADSGQLSTSSEEEQAIPGSSVWVASSGLKPVAQTAQEKMDQYNDEYAKLFGTFRPFAPPHEEELMESSHKPQAVSSEEALAALFGETCTKDQSTDESTAAAANHAHTWAQMREDEFVEHLVGLTSTVATTDDALEAASFGTTTREQYHAIGIKKIRRKKMNKHKLNKLRKLNRNSSRYNKAKKKKRAEIREQSAE